MTDKSFKQYSGGKSLLYLLLVKTTFLMEIEKWSDIVFEKGGLPFAP